MRNRTPVPRAERPPLPGFTPVPRKSARHDGWTPERQRAFIEALADTGSVSRACAMVNMSTYGAYYLRRQPGADEFRRAWEAALDYGVARMKDIAFERAITGYLVPMFVGGKLIGWRRKYNDRLLMFCLRHYGEDANGKRTTVNYFSTRATAGAASSSPPGGGRPAQVVEGAAVQTEASTAVVRTTIAHNAGPEDLAASLGDTAAAIDGFDGIELDQRAQAEIAAVLEQCAARRRAALGTADDEAEPFIAAIPPPRPLSITDELYLEPGSEPPRDPPVYPVAAFPHDMVEHDPTFLVDPDDIQRMGPDELPWEMLGDEEGIRAIEEAAESVRQARLAPPESENPGEAGQPSIVRPEQVEGRPLQPSSRRKPGPGKRKNRP